MVMAMLISVVAPAIQTYSSAPNAHATFLCDHGHGPECFVIPAGHVCSEDYGCVPVYRSETIIVPGHKHDAACFDTIEEYVHEHDSSCQSYDEESESYSECNIPEYITQTIVICSVEEYEDETYTTEFTDEPPVVWVCTAEPELSCLHMSCVYGDACMLGCEECAKNENGEPCDNCREDPPVICEECAKNENGEPCDNCREETPADCDECAKNENGEPCDNCKEETPEPCEECAKNENGELCDNCKEETPEPCEECAKNEDGELCDACKASTPGIAAERATCTCTVSISFDGSLEIEASELLSGIDIGDILLQGVSAIDENGEDFTDLVVVANDGGSARMARECMADPSDARLTMGSSSGFSVTYSVTCPEHEDSLVMSSPREVQIKAQPLQVWLRNNPIALEKVAEGTLRSSDERNLQGFHPNNAKLTWQQVNNASYIQIVMTENIKLSCKSITVPAGRSIEIVSNTQGANRQIIQEELHSRHFIVRGTLFISSDITLYIPDKDNKGGVIVESGGVFDMAGAIDMRNRSYSSAALQYVVGVMNGGTFNMTGGEIRNIGTGCGVKIIGGEFNMFDGQIRRGNTNKRGSGVILNRGLFNMYGGMITGHTSPEIGGGVNVEIDSVFNMYGGSINNNSAPNGRGGGVSVSGRSFFVMSGNATIYNNTSPKGGGVSLDGGSRLEMSGDASIKGNTANSGGGVYVIVSEGVNGNKGIIMNGGEISGNKAQRGDGGGIWADMIFGEEAIAVTINEGRIVGNEASGKGGGIFISNSSAGIITSDRSVFLLNTAGQKLDYGINEGLRDYPDIKWYEVNSLGGRISPKRAPHLLNSFDVYYNGVQYNEFEPTDTDSDWERLRAAIESAGISGVVIHGFDSDNEDRIDGSVYHLVISDKDRANDFSINRTGTPIEVTRNMELLAADRQEITLWNNGERAGGSRHFLVESGTFVIGADTASGGYPNAGTIILDGRLSYAPGAGIGVNSGGVYVGENGTLMLLGNSAIRGCQADDGGGVYVDGGSLILNGGTISQNKSSTGGRNSGGGVFVMDGVFNMISGEISLNNAHRSSREEFDFGGGGVYISNGTFTMDGGIISGNTTSSTATVSDTKYGGGGVYIEGDGSLFAMNAGAITENHGHNGGGVFASSGALFIMNDGALISGNISINNGGGVEFNTSAKFVMNGGIISKNSARAWGGGLRCIMAEFEMKGGTITENNAYYGGGISGNYLSQITITGGNITRNEAVVYGGGAQFVDSSLIVMNGGTISGNRSPLGAGVRSIQSDFTLNDGRINNNHGGRNGGGVYLDDGLFTMNGGAISGNTAQLQGGGVYISAFGNQGGLLVLNAGTISGNSATEGGGVFVVGKLMMNGGAISANTAEKSGGGIFIRALAMSDVTISAGRISGNEAMVDGGGIFAEGFSLLTVAQAAEFYDNTAQKPFWIEDYNENAAYVPAAGIGIRVGDLKARHNGTLLPAPGGSYSSPGSETSLFGQTSFGYLANNFDLNFNGSELDGRPLPALMNVPDVNFGWGTLPSKRTLYGLNGGTQITKGIPSGSNQTVNQDADYVTNLMFSVENPLNTWWALTLHCTPFVGLPGEAAEPVVVGNRQNNGQMLERAFEDGSSMLMYSSNDFAEDYARDQGLLVDGAAVWSWDMMRNDIMVDTHPSEVGEGTYKSLFTWTIELTP